MAEHNLLGEAGEKAACLYLSQREYHLLERNWIAGHWEIDIIAEHFGEIVFVEVKTRSKGSFEDALSAVDKKKMTNLLNAANHYLQVNQIYAPFRFDVITLIGKAPDFEISHLVDAFSLRTVRKRNTSR